MADSPAPRKSVIELLILVFKNSEVKEIVGTDALRSVLEIRYRDMTKDGDFNLTPLWDLLCDQPGFEAAAATPALCKFKSWERYVGRTITLPAALADLDAATIADWASGVDIAKPDLDRALAGEDDPEPRARSKRTSLIDEAVLSETVPDQVGDSRSLGSRFAGWEIPLAVIALVGLLIGGYSIYGYACRGPSFKAIQADFGPIPVKQIQQLGDQVGAVLVDEAWMSLPREQQEEHLGAVLRRLAGSQVSVVYLTTAKGEQLASAKFSSDGASISYHFFQ